MWAAGCPSMWTIYITQNHTNTPCHVERKKSLIFGKCGMWCLKDGWLHQHNQKGKDTRGLRSLWSDRKSQWGANDRAGCSWHDIQEAERERDRDMGGGRGQEARIPTHTWRGYLRDILIQLGHISFSPYLLSIASVPRGQVSIIGASGSHCRVFIQEVEAA